MKDNTYQYYAGNMVYNTSKALDYIIMEEGLIRNTSGAFTYEYNLKDHLGNTRVVFKQNGAKLDSLQIADYYPFGSTFNPINPNNGNKYLYNGKEKQDDNLGGTALDWYDYGTRFYDPMIGRWHSIDQLAEGYFDLSPYKYCANNPIIFIDPDGMKFDNPEDEERARQSQEAARTKSAEYTKMANDLQKKENLTDEDKAKIKEYQSMAGILNTQADHLGEMITNTDWSYAYNKVTDPQADLVTEYKDGVVVMDYAEGESGKQAHEETHGYQYISGDLTIKDEKDDLDSYDLGDEANAYQVEYSMRNEEKQNRFVAGIGNYKGSPIIKSVNDITPGNLAKSKIIQQAYSEIVQKYNKSH